MDIVLGAVFAGLMLLIAWSYFDIAKAEIKDKEYDLSDGSDSDISDSLDDADMNGMH